MATLTSANATLSLSVSGIFNSPIIIQGFAMDDIFNGENTDNAETVMGADGILSAGKIFVAKRTTVHLMATSPSLDFFDQWQLNEDAQVDVFPAQGTLVVPSINRIYTLTRGFLKSYTPFPALKKTLQTAQYVIEWESITASPSGSF